MTKSMRSAGVLAVTTLALLAACSPPPSQTPGPDAVVIPSASASVPAVTTRGPAVFFIVTGDTAAPIACFDGKAFIPSDSSDCLQLAPAGAPIAIEGGGQAVLAGDAQVPCGKSEFASNTFEARALTGNAKPDASWGIWPASARDRVKPEEAALKPTAAEQAELDKLLASFVRDLDAEASVAGIHLDVRGGLAIDMDGDGQPDRAFAGYYDGRMVGVTAVFLGKEPRKPVLLSAMEHDSIQLTGSVDLDGDGRRELWLDASFLEGIENSVLTSAVSVRLIELDGGEGKRAGDWGCRMF